MTQVVRLWNTEFRNPFVLAAGTAGFGREIARVVDLGLAGAIATKAVSPLPRGGNAPPRVSEFEGGMINSVGLANPGLEAVDADHLPWLAANSAGARIIVNVVGFSLEDYRTVVARLDRHSGVTAFELNVSCPNTERGGQEFGADDGVLADLVAGCRQVTSRPLIVKLGPGLPDVVRTARRAVAAGADGFTLVNTLAGFLFSRAGHGEPRLGNGRGGVSGPALLAAGVLATRLVAGEVGAPVIGLGGVTSREDAAQYLEAGASLVGIGTATMAHPRVLQRLANWWNRDG